MTTSAQVELKPNPDPTVYTNEAIERASKSERDYVDGKVAVLAERLDRMDEATKLARSDIVKIPCQIKEGVDGLKVLLSGELRSINEKFEAAEKVRIEQKQDSKESIDFALTAAKEAITEQNNSNNEKINKSETSVNETIKSNQDANKQITDGLTKTLDELKSTVGAIVAAQASRSETIIDARSTRADSRGGLSSVSTAIASVVAVGAILFAAYSHNSTPATTNEPLVTCSATYHPAPCPQ